MSHFTKKNTNISFLGCGIALWLGKQISGSEGLFYTDPEKLKEAGAGVNMECEVTKVDPEKKEVHVKMQDGSEIVDKYDKLILATGSLPLKPSSIPGLDLENVLPIKIYQHAQALHEKADEEGIENVCVIGAGYIGVELAEAMQRRGKKVKLIDIADDCLSCYYDDPFRKMMCENLQEHGIDCRFGETVEELIGEDGKVKQVKTSKGTYDCDLAIVCIGFKPNTELLKDKLETYKNGAYLVDLHQQTSDPDIYAVGDCATIYSNPLEQITYIALATNAVRSGIVGAHNAAGTDLKSIGVQGSNGINIYGLKMVSTGLTVEAAEKAGIDVGYTDFEDTQMPAFMECKNPVVKIRIVYRKDDRRVIGAQLASEHDISMMIHFFSLAIQERVTIDKIALTDIFFLPHFNQPYNYVTMAALSAE